MKGCRPAQHRRLGHCNQYRQRPVCQSKRRHCVKSVATLFSLLHFRTDEIGVFVIGMSVGTIRRLIRIRSSAVRFLTHVAALFSLQLQLAVVTEEFDALRGSSMCGFIKRHQHHHHHHHQYTHTHTHHRYEHHHDQDFRHHPLAIEALIVVVISLAVVGVGVVVGVVGVVVAAVVVVSRR